MSTNDIASGRIRVRLHAIRYAAEGVHCFEFRPVDGQPLPPFDPGAHIDVHLPNALIRQYSIASPPADRTRYEVAVKRDAHSRGGSSWLFEHAHVGDLFDIGAPRNHFPLDEQAPHTLLIAGGIGITPIYCMANRLAALGREWRLVYAVRRRAEAAFGDELRATYPDHVSLHVDEEHGGRPIDLPALIAEAPAQAALYCCGPAPMLDAFEAATAARPRELVHVERFTAAAPAATDGGYFVELARAKRRIYVAPGRTIAEALIEAGIQVAISCEQGICGTCETRVLAGIPEHRDALLSAEEKAANDVMMICCSGSRSETLVLDL